MGYSTGKAGLRGSHQECEEAVLTERIATTEKVNVGLRGFRGRPRARLLRGDVRRQEAHLPLQGLQEGGQEAGVQGVRDLHLAPRRAQCRQLRQQRAAQLLRVLTTRWC